MLKNSRTRKNVTSFRQFLAHNKNNGFSNYFNETYVLNFILFASPPPLLLLSPSRIDNYYYIFFFKLIPSLKVGLDKIYAFVIAV